MITATYIVYACIGLFLVGRGSYMAGKSDGYCQRINEEQKRKMRDEA